MEYFLTLIFYLAVLLLRMKKVAPFFYIWILATTVQFSVAQPKVPSRLSFCEVELVLTSEAKTKIQAEVNKIYVNARFLDDLTQRVHLYFPFIEEALAETILPSDFKYLAIQESGLKPDAISTSQAVGFWQFKRETAESVGMIVNTDIDERKHIFKSTLGAAKYFKENNVVFDNWIYALIAYYEGQSGAIPYTDIQYYGAKNMTIGGDFHWYALKCIAHKIAFEPLLSDIPNRNTYFLSPFLSDTESTLSDVYTRHGISETDFLGHNPWVNNRSFSPAQYPLAYYIPKEKDAETGYIANPGSLLPAALIADLSLLDPKAAPLPEPTGKPVSTQTDTVLEAIPAIGEKPVPDPYAMRADPSALTALPYEKLEEGSYALFDVENDLHYRRYYVCINEKLSFKELAALLKVSPGTLATWNGFLPHEIPGTGTLMYLTPPGKKPFHVVRQEETLIDIAYAHNMTVSKIQKRNRMKSKDFQLYIGQKLNLLPKKAKGEKCIILKYNPQSGTPGTQTAPILRPNNSPTPTVPSTTTTREIPPATPQNIPKIITPDQFEKPLWIDHTVQAGETLWSLAKKYGTRVELIKKINKLEADTLSTGQVLRIFATTTTGDKE